MQNPQLICSAPSVVTLFKKVFSKVKVISLTLEIDGEFIFRLKAQALYDSPATNWFVKAPERELTKNSITSTFFKVIWFLGSWLLPQISHFGVCASFLSPCHVSVAHYALKQVAPVAFLPVGLNLWDAQLDATSLTQWFLLQLKETWSRSFNEAR